MAFSSALLGPGLINANPIHRPLLSRKGQQAHTFFGLNRVMPDFTKRNYYENFSMETVTRIWISVKLQFFFFIL